MLFSTTACGGGNSALIDSIESVDKEKTQLYVGVYDGAIGYEWLNEYKKPILRPSTYAGYSKDIANHILPYLGSECFQRYP